MRNLQEVVVLQTVKSVQVGVMVSELMSVCNGVVVMYGNLKNFL